MRRDDICLHLSPVDRNLGQHLLELVEILLGLGVLGSRLSECLWDFSNGVA
jgi:hypothetical protein